MTLAAQRQGRLMHIRNQLDGGLRVLSPQVHAEGIAKPLSISFEEIIQDKVLAEEKKDPEPVEVEDVIVEIDEPEEEEEETSSWLFCPCFLKRIVLGVSGGIAAYKSVDKPKTLVDAGAFVSPIMTAAAEKFVGKVTLSALASEPVKSSLWEDEDPILHTTLGQETDLLIGSSGHGETDRRIRLRNLWRPAVSYATGCRAPVVLLPSNAHRNEAHQPYRTISKF